LCFNQTIPPVDPSHEISPLIPMYWLNHHNHHNHHEIVGKKTGKKTRTKPKNPAGWPGYLGDRVSIMWGVVPFLTAAGEFFFDPNPVGGIDPPLKNIHQLGSSSKMRWKNAENETWLKPTRNSFLTYLGSLRYSGSPKMKTKVRAKCWCGRSAEKLFQTCQNVGIDPDRDMIMIIGVTMATPNKTRKHISYSKTVG
jgi:hypothetical protein